MSSGPVRRLAVAGVLLLGAYASLRPLPAQPAASVVRVIAVDGVIDLGLAPFLARTIREAQAERAAAVLLDINTFGGRVDAAVAMRDTLLNAEVRTIAFVNQRAISAGALIALACETIVMTRGGTIGAAAPVIGGGTGETRAADEKSVSYVRKEFRATAEARDRPPEIAEAMVDADVEIPNLVAAGKLLTLTTAEALRHEVADFEAATLAQALEAVDLGGAELRYAEQTWAEGVVRFLTNPVVSSLLMTLGLLGLFIEIRTPGFALPGTLGLVSLGLFFWGHWLVQLAGWEELLLVLVGVLLVGLELLVFPGITVAGVAGVVLLVIGLGMTILGAGATMPAVVSALGRVAFSILAALVAAFALFRALPVLPFGRRLVLDSGVGADAGYVSAPESQHAWLGRTGVALSPLRPAGTADLGGERVDVVSDGGFIEAGSPIVVTRVDGYRIVVRRPPPPPPRQESST